MKTTAGALLAAGISGMGQMCLGVQGCAPGCQPFPLFSSTEIVFILLYSDCLMAPFSDKVSPSSPKSAAGPRKLPQMLLFLCGVRLVPAWPQGLSAVQSPKLLPSLYFTAKIKHFLAWESWWLLIFFFPLQTFTQVDPKEQAACSYECTCRHTTQTFLYRTSTSSAGC